MRRLGRIVVKATLLDLPPVPQLTGQDDGMSGLYHKGLQGLCVSSVRLVLRRTAAPLRRHAPLISQTQS